MSCLKEVNYFIILFVCTLGLMEITWSLGYLTEVNHQHIAEVINDCLPKMVELLAFEGKTV